MNNRQVSIKYELLNRFNGFKRQLSGAGGTIDMDSRAEIKKSAQFEIREKDLEGVNFLNDRIRPIYVLNGVEYPLGVFIVASPDRHKNSGGVYRKIDCYDITQILKEDKVLRPYYASEGTQYTRIIPQLIESANILDYEIVETDAAIKRSREFEIGTPKLDIINELLKEINYTSLYTDLTGRLRAKPYIMPNYRNAEFIYSTEDNIIKDSGVEHVNTFEIPNIIIGVVSNTDTPPLKSIYKNEDPNSPLSTVTRGRNIVKKLEFSDINDSLTLDALVKRSLYEETSQYSQYSFESLINPKHNVENCLEIKDKTLGIESRYIETSWSMDLSVGGVMRHTCEKVEMI